MKIFIVISISLLLISALLVAGFLSYGREKTWERFYGEADLGPFDLTKISRSNQPNDAYICSPKLCAEGVSVDANLPVFKQPPAEIITKIEQALQNSGLKHARVDDKSDPAQARFLTWSETFRFPDTNQFLAVPLEDGNTGLIAYARAQVGYADGGANLKRLKKLTDAIQR